MKPATYAQGLSPFWPPVKTPRVRVPLFAEPCSAGFPSPAADYIEKELDLNELCIRRRASVNAKIIGRFSPFLMSAIGH